MQDTPSAAELLEALAAFLSEDVVGELQGRKRFMALVAASVAGIVARELRLAPQQLERETADLWRLLDKPGVPPENGPSRELVLQLNRELCDRIDAGDADERSWRKLLMAHLRTHVGEKLEVTNPSFKKKAAAD